MGDLEQRLDILLANYQQDVLIYREILLETAKMEARLTEGAARRRAKSSESVSLSGGEWAAREQDSDAYTDQEMDAVEGFVSWRQEKLQDITQRRQETAAVREAVCQELGVEDVDEDVIQRAYPALLASWRQIMTDIQGKGAQVLASDEKIFQLLKMDREFMRLEMHRMQDVKKSRQVYAPQMRGEAQYIDKNR